MNAGIIDALTGLNEATERVQKSDVGITAAYNERGEALRYLNELQKQFDDMYTHLVQNAPPGSYWSLDKTATGTGQG